MVVSSSFFINYTLSAGVTCNNRIYDVSLSSTITAVVIRVGERKWGSVSGHKNRTVHAVYLLPMMSLSHRGGIKSNQQQWTDHYYPIHQLYSMGNMSTFATAATNKAEDCSSEVGMSEKGVEAQDLKDVADIEVQVAGIDRAIERRWVVPMSRVDGGTWTGADMGYCYHLSKDVEEARFWTAPCTRNSLPVQCVRQVGSFSCPMGTFPQISTNLLTFLKGKSLQC